MLPIASYELAKAYKKHGTFVIDEYLKKYDEENKTNYSSYSDKKMLKVGQKVLVLKNDTEFEKRNNIDFQRNRLYVITQFSEGSIWLKYHLEADPENVERNAKLSKDIYFRELEKKNGLSEIQEDITIENKRERNKDFETRKFAFNSVSDYRPSRLVPILGEKEVKKVIKDLRSNFAATPSKIGIEGQTPLLKMSSDNWNFLYENEDFDVSLLGKLTFKKLNR